MVQLLISGNKSGRTVCDVLRNEGWSVKYIRAPFPFRKRALLHPTSVLRGIWNVKRSLVVLAESLTGGWEICQYARTLGIPHILHFTGTDALLYQESRGSRKRLWDGTVQNATLVSAQTIQLAEIIEDMGQACVVWESPFNYFTFSWQTTRNPIRDHLCYAPDPQIYRLRDTLAFAAKHKKLTFTILGNFRDGKPPNSSNVIFRPLAETESELKKIYLQHRGLLRLTTNDGSPFMVREALAMGLRVCWKVADNPPQIFRGSRQESARVIHRAKDSVKQLRKLVEEIRIDP